jgi:hypothetical protein
VARVTADIKEFRPWSAVRWGFAIVVGAAVLELFIPSVAFNLSTTAGSELDKAMTGALVVILRVAPIALPSVGAALIAAGIVALYFEKTRSAPEQRSHPQKD